MPAAITTPRPFSTLLRVGRQWRCTVCLLFLILVQFNQAFTPVSRLQYSIGTTQNGFVVTPAKKSFLFSKTSNKNDEDNNKDNDDGSQKSSKTDVKSVAKVNGETTINDKSTAESKNEIKATTTTTTATNATKAENTTATTATTNETKIDKVVGIGGQGGIVYDVNRLKKNLVQETVREYKRELMELLGTPFATESVIEDKLAALVQANPVSCTTDSNLLDGLWAYAFGSYTAAADMLLDSSRYLLTNKRKREQQREQELMMNMLSSSSSGTAIASQPILRLRPGTAESPFRSVTRQFNLEDLKDHEDAHVMDQTNFLGGLFSKTRRYNVQSLTRTSLQLDIAQSQTRMFGKRLWERRYEAAQRKPLELQILYLDGDLCVSTSQEGGPFHVYTKSDYWTEGSRTRKVRYSVAVLRVIQKYLLSVINCRKQVYKLVSRLRPKNQSQEDENEKDLMMTERNIGDGTTLKVLKLGDLNNDNHAWEGEEDPFVHLTADERQQMLRELKVKDIIGRKEQQDRKNKRKKKRPPIFQRKMPFKKPDKQ